ERRIRFILGWHFPNRYRTERYGWAPPLDYRYRLGNRYNTWFHNAEEVVRHTASNYDRLYRQTKAFSDAVWDSNLPLPVQDAVASNLAILRSGILMWLEDGNWFGFEGADACCPLNCTHVYNYAQSIAYCFPELEKAARTVEWKVQQHPDKGYIPHRVILPLDLPRLWERGIGGPYNPALDGMLGAVLKTYRDYLLTGDADWLRHCLPNVALLLRHVFERFDPDGDGVIRGEQPNTYDIHTFGSNTFIGTLYLAALKAFPKMVAAAYGGPNGGYSDLIRECEERYHKGRDGYVTTCWNGEFFINAYDAPGADPNVYEQYNCWGPGCHCDQLLGQWWAKVLNLGDLLPTEMIRSALWSIYRYNWRRSLRGFKHSQRVFAEGDEKGLIVCTWPNGGRPRQPILYCDEVWTGHEYEVAALLLWYGFTDQGLEIVEGARARYDGTKRNPFAELECGHYYSRALSSWTLLSACLGFACDAAKGIIQFLPNLKGDLRAPFSGGVFWGVVEKKEKGRSRGWTIRVLEGTFSITELILSATGDDGQRPVKVTLNGKTVAVSLSLKETLLILRFARPQVLKEGSVLSVGFG
ncbi:MAG: non-lysosomal glucosylceramidase, partial [Armatimonadetes bacterium]|nr:non-lysosomal glucosylceramidase [Armatimonadota bacterium]MDW8121946.1 GH116 family glycosyl hydrolase [Armatimonadota bacterium]